jgi:hypothetical protein
MTWQFFIGSEFFAMTVVALVVAAVVLVVGAALVDRQGLALSWAYSWQALALATVTTLVLLAAPVAYATLGPAHYNGLVWPGVTLSNVSIRGFLTAASPLHLWFADSPWHFLPPTYLAPAIIVTMACGLIWQRRDRTVLAVVALAAAMAWLALGQRYVFSAWHWAVRLPLLENVVNERFAAFMFLFVALAVVIIVERILDARTGVVSVALASLVMVTSLAPYAIDAAHVAPYPASALWVPSWYQHNAAKLPDDSVVLGFPFFNTSANLLGVQAHYRMHYAIVGGTTPQWLPSRQGPASPGYLVIWRLASTKRAPNFPPTATAAQRSALLHALAYWRVSDVVVPFTNGPNTSSVARDPAFVRTFLASVLGEPVAQDGAWVWHPLALARSSR